MAFVTNFTFCNNAENNNNLTNAKGIFSILRLEYLPSAYSFTIIFSILGIDLRVKNKIKIEIFNPQNESIFKTNEIFFESEFNEKDGPYSLDFTLDIRNVLFKEEGFYVTKLIYNDEVIYTSKFYLKGENKNDF